MTVPLRIKSTLGDHQLRAGIDLVSSSALNAIAGLAFWFVAARGFHEAIVGINAAAITTMSLVESFSTLGLKNVLIRFMPRRTADAKAFVLRIYGITVLATAIVAPLVAITVGRQMELAEVLTSPAGVIAFTIASMVWIVFVLQDSVLVSIGRTPLIPASNLAYAAMKLLLLAVFALTTYRWSIFLAWVAPLAVIVAWVNVSAFRTINSAGPRTQNDPEPTGLVRFAAGDFAGTFLAMGLFGLLPLFVISELGERASAFYALSFSIAYSLMLANSNISIALLAAASREDGDLRRQTTKAIRQMAVLVVPAALGVVVLAPVALRIFGSSYADEGSNLLRLLALTAVANIPVSTAIGVYRSQRRMKQLVSLHAARTSLIGFACVMFSMEFGVTGMGLGWLVGETAIALVVGIGASRQAAAATIS